MQVSTEVLPPVSCTPEGRKQNVKYVSEVLMHCRCFCAGCHIRYVAVPDLSHQKFTPDALFMLMQLKQRSWWPRPVECEAEPPRYNEFKTDIFVLHDGYRSNEHS